MEISLSSIPASVKNGGRRAALCGVQSLCFLDLASFPAAARRSTSEIRRQLVAVHGKGKVDVNLNKRM